MEGLRDYGDRITVTVHLIGSAKTMGKASVGQSSMRRSSKRPRPGPAAPSHPENAVQSRAILAARDNKVHCHRNLLSDEVEARLLDSLGLTPDPAKADTDPATAEAPLSILTPQLRLAPTEWQSGNHLWLIDFVCPFGGTAEAMQQLREETFKGREVKTVRNAPETGPTVLKVNLA